LALALSELPPFSDDRVLVGENSADDAGIMLISPDRALVHTVDLLAPVVNDPYTFGRIAAVNSISDIYAMGGTPLCALNVIGIPADLDAEVVGRILRGGQDAVLDAGAVPIGGHTFQDTEIRYGLAVVGEISPRRIVTNSDARPGDLLVMTKPLGTGIVIQALMTRGVVTEALYRDVVQSMLTSNRAASEAMLRFDVSACTDVTGFGFIGHCWMIASGSGVGVKVRSSKLPVFDKVLDLIGDGVVDAGFNMNKNSFEKYIDFGDGVPPEFTGLLYSSETSGGLLISVSEKDVEALTRSLHDSGLDAAEVVGEVVAEHPDRLEIQP